MGQCLRVTTHSLNSIHGRQRLHLQVRAFTQAMARNPQTTLPKAKSPAYHKHTKKLGLNMRQRESTAFVVLFGLAFPPSFVCSFLRSYTADGQAHCGRALEGVSAQGSRIGRLEVRMLCSMLQSLHVSIAHLLQGTQMDLPPQLNQRCKSSCFQGPYSASDNAFLLAYRTPELRLFSAQQAASGGWMTSHDASLTIHKVG